MKPRAFLAPALYSRRQDYDILKTICQIGLRKDQQSPCRDSILKWAVLFSASAIRLVRFFEIVTSSRYCAAVFWFLSRDFMLLFKSRVESLSYLSLSLSLFASLFWFTSSLFIDCLTNDNIPSFHSLVSYREIDWRYVKIFRVTATPKFRGYCHCG